MLEDNIYAEFSSDILNRMTDETLKGLFDHFRKDFDIIRLVLYHENDEQSLFLEMSDADITTELDKLIEVYKEDLRYCHWNFVSGAIEIKLQQFFADIFGGAISEVMFYASRDYFKKSELQKLFHGVDELEKLQTISKVINLIKDHVI